MNEDNTGRRVATRTAKGILALATLTVGLVVAAPPAIAATTCLQGDGALVVHVDEADPTDETLIEVRSGLLYVNDELCGTGMDDSITIIDEGDPKVDRIRLNLGAGAFRMDGAPVFVNLILDQPAPDGSRDEVRIRGTKGVDIVSLRSDFIVVARDTPYAGTVDDTLRLLMSTAGSDAKFYFLLRAGNDIFQMGRGADDNHYSGFVQVKGGPGRDELIGGPGRQRLRGGAGADVIEGKGGRDLLFGNSGADFIKGGKGADEITGGKGRDDVRAGSGADILHMRDSVVDDVGGQKGTDVCFCDANDNLSSASRG